MYADFSLTAQAAKTAAYDESARLRQYIEYTIRPRDAPESISRCLWCTAHRLDAILSFSQDNAEVLARTQIGTSLRILKRLLVWRGSINGHAGEN
jgi:hypothetical protein